jgi:hypothetical protein
VDACCENNCRSGCQRVSTKNGLIVPFNLCEVAGKSEISLTKFKLYKNIDVCKISTVNGFTLYAKPNQYVLNESGKEIKIDRLSLGEKLTLQCVGLFGEVHMPPEAFACGYVAGNGDVNNYPGRFSLDEARCFSGIEVIPEFVWRGDQQTCHAFLDGLSVSQKTSFHHGNFCYHGSSWFLHNLQVFLMNFGVNSILINNQLQPGGGCVDVVDKIENFGKACLILPDADLYWTCSGFITKI